MDIITEWGGSIMQKVVFFNTYKLKKGVSVPDFLHAADVSEDVMIGRSLDSFKPQRPSDFTVGRLSPITLFSRQQLLFRLR